MAQGPDRISIRTPDGSERRVPRGASALALARELPGDAARAAVFAHGMSADECARAIGPVGFAAGDVAAALPRVLAALLRARDEEIERGGQEKRPAPDARIGG